MSAATRPLFAGIGSALGSTLFGGGGLAGAAGTAAKVGLRVVPVIGNVLTAIWVADMLTGGAISSKLMGALNIPTKEELEELQGQASEKTRQAYMGASRQLLSEMRAERLQKEAREREGTNAQVNISAQQARQAADANELQMELAKQALKYTPIQNILQGQKESVGNVAAMTMGENNPLAHLRAAMVRREMSGEPTDLLALFGVL